MNHNDNSETIFSVPDPEENLRSPGEKKPLAPGDFLGTRYIARKRLGRGGMGEVWLADEMDAGEKVQDVVVKIVPPEVQASAAEMAKIRQTFEHTKRLRHPNICSALTVGTDERYGVFLVMDYVVGESLAKYQADQDGGVFSLDETLEILTPLAAALDFAHEQRILHRDIKPENIMVPFQANSTRHKEVKLIDFGLAAEMQVSMTSVSQHVVRRASGTLPYMPPEQINGEEQNHRSDQYSLAVMAYEMLTGKRPFRSPDVSVLIHQITTKPVPPILGVPEHVNKAISRASAKERKERFDSCAEFVAAMKKPMVRLVRPVAKTSVPTPPPVSLVMPEEKEAPAMLDPLKWAEPTAKSYGNRPRRTATKPNPLKWVVPGVVILLVLGWFWFFTSSPKALPKVSSNAPPKEVSSDAPSEISSPEAPPVKQMVEDSRKAGERMTLTAKGVEYAFRWCPAGKFMMGSPEEEFGRQANEMQHEVTLTKGFWMLETEVTQEMWEAVMGSNPSPYRSNVKLAVNDVSWDDCRWYIKELNALGVAPVGYKFSLPTEAQWEYASRAGTTTPYHFGSDLNGDKANCNGNYPYGTETKGTHRGNTTVVGLYPANAWGLYDMHGNVVEWCLDWYGAYPGGSVMDPTGPTTGSNHVLRGGSWSSHAVGCRSAFRDGSRSLTYRNIDVGLRLALVRE